MKHLTVETLWLSGELKHLTVETLWLSGELKHLTTEILWLNGEFKHLTTEILWLIGEWEYLTIEPTRLIGEISWSTIQISSVFIEIFSENYSFSPTGTCSPCLVGVWGLHTIACGSYIKQGELHITLCGLHMKWRGNTSQPVKVMGCCNKLK